jgi:hypothetical protein
MPETLGASQLIRPQSQPPWRLSGFLLECEISLDQTSEQMAAGLSLGSPKGQKEPSHTK